MSDDTPVQRTLLRLLFLGMVERAQADEAMRGLILPRAEGRTVVVGAGKAAAAMARAAEDLTDVPIEGVVVTRFGYAVPCRRLHIVEAAHPIPDAQGCDAARRILSLAEGLTEKDRLIFLVSGGASALLSLPAPPLTIADKQAVTRALLASGAPIGELNTVRKHLSAIKGGRLAVAAWPAPVLTLAISDVVGDDPSIIGSGPTVGDPTTLAEARAILDRRRIALPSAVAAYLHETATETPKPGDPRLARSEVRIVARPEDALAAAARIAERNGLDVIDLGPSVEGEARAVAADHARRALDLLASVTRPTVLLSGGELTVTVRGKGRGGPNMEYALALAVALDGAPGIHALAADTDGIDGPTDDAGAVVSPDTLERARALGLDPAAALADNDSYGFFAALGDLVTTGPTLTNVNDFRAVLIQPYSATA